MPNGGDQEIQSLDRELIRLQKSTRTTVPALLPLHDILRQKYRWYYKWSLWSGSKVIHVLILLGFLFFLGNIFYQLTLSQPSQVLAATGTEDPSASVSHTWSLSPVGGSVVTYLTDVVGPPPYDDSTYMYENTPGGEEVLGFPNPSPLTVGTVTDIRVNVRLKSGAAEDGAQLRISGDNGLNWIFCGEVINSVGSFTPQSATCSGLSWTQAELDILRVKVSKVGPLANNTYISDLSVTVTYTPVITISGTAYTSDAKSATINNCTNCVGLSINGGAKSLVSTNGSGVFSFTDKTVAAGNTITLYLTGGTYTGNYVSRAKDDSSAISAELYANDIVLSSEDTTAMSNTLLATANNCGDCGTDIKFTDAGGAVSFNTSYKLWISSSKEYKPGGTVTTAGAVTIMGTFSPEANTINISGSWTSDSGTVNYGTSTVNMTGSGTITAKASTFTFYNLKCAPAGLTTTIGANNVYVTNILYYEGGNLSPANQFVYLYKSDGDPVVIDSGTGAGITSAVVYGPNADISVAGHTFGGDVIFWGRKAAGTTTTTLTSGMSTGSGKSLYVYGTGAGMVAKLSTGANGITAGNCYVGANATYVGILDLGSGTHTCTGDLTHYPTYTPSGSSIIFGTSNTSIGGSIDFTGIGITTGTGASTVTMTAGAAGKTITSDSKSFNYLTFDSSNGSGAWSLSDNLTAKNLTLTDGILTDNAKTVTVNGNISIANTASILVSTGSWIQGASGNIINPQGSNSFRNLTIAGAGVNTTLTGTVYAGSSANATNDGLTIGPGTLTGGNQMLVYNNYAAGNTLTINNPIMGSALSRFSYATYVAQTVSALTFPNGFATTLNFANGNNTTASITAGGHLNFGNNSVYIQGATSGATAPTTFVNMATFNLTAGNLYLGYSTANGYLKLGSGTHSVSGNLSKSTTGTANLLDMGSTPGITVSGNVDLTNITATAGTSTLVMNGASKTLTGNGQTLKNFTVDNTILASGNFAVGGNFTINSGKVFQPSAASVISGAGTLTGQGTAEVKKTGDNAFSTQYTIANKTLTNLLIKYSGAEGQTVSNNADLGSTYGGLEIAMAGQVATLDGTTTTGGTLTISAGTLDGGGQILNVAGNFANSGIFTANGSTVNLTGADGSTQTLSGSSTTTFNNLSATSTAARTIKFTDGTTTNVAGTWTVTGGGTPGDQTKNITLTGTGAAGWTINPTNLDSPVSYVTVSYSTNSGGKFCATYSTNGGNNTGWYTDTGSSCAATAPNNVSINPDSATQITTNWNDNSSNESGFKVYRSTSIVNNSCSDPATVYVLDTTTGPDTTSYPKSPLSVNSRYCAKVIASNSWGDSSAVYSTPKYTLAATPDGPGAAAGSWGAGTGNPVTVTLALGANPGGTKIKTLAKAVPAGEDPATYCPGATYDGLVQDYTVHDNSDSVAHNTLTADTYYCYKNQAENGDDVVNETLSSSIYALTAPAQPAITGQAHNTVEGHTANTTSSITWGWNANTVSPDGYKVYEDNAGTCLDGVAPKITTGSTGGLENAGFSANTSYRRCVEAYRGAIHGQPTAGFSAYTSANDPVTLGHSGNTTSGLSWTWSSGGAQKDFYASDSTGNNGWQVGTGWDAAIGHATNTQYTLSVKARNGDNDETGDFTASAYTSIETPTGITALATADSTSQIDISITNPLSNLAAGSSGVFFGEIGGNPGGGADACFDWSKINSCADTGLSANSLYRYTARARNGDGENTDLFSAQDRYTRIETPTTITAGLITPNSIALSISDSLTNLNLGSSGIQYTEYSGNPGAGGEAAFTGWPQSAGTTDAGLQGAISGNTGTSYRYKIKARNADGIETALSPEFTFTTTAGTQLLFQLPGETLDESGAYLLSYSDPNPDTVTAGVPFNLTIKAADGANYRDLAHQDTITLSSTDTEATFPVAAAMTQGDITYNGVVMKTVGNQTISGTGSSGSSHEFVVAPGACSASASTATASPTSLNVGETSTVTITLVDSFGNKLAGHAVAVGSDQVGDSISFSAATTDANGRIYAYVTTTSAHISTITVSDTTDAVVLDDQPQITFNALPTPTPTPNASATATATPTAIVTPGPSGDKEPPTVPTNLRTTAIGETTIDLAWNASTDNVGVSGYELFNADTGIRIATTADTFYSLSGLKPDTVYRFYVRAFDAAGNYSANSNTLSVRTRKPTGPEPEEIVAFLVMSNLPESINAGQVFPEKVRVSAADAGGRIVSTYNKAIYFTSSDKNAQLAVDSRHMYTFTAVDAGIHEFAGQSFVLNTGGRQKLTVSDFSTSTTSEIDVISAPAVPSVVRDFFTKSENLSRVNTGVVITTALALLIPILINTAFALGTILPQVSYWLLQLLQLLGIRKRRKSWGVVFNSQSGQPIALAVVRIFDKQYNRVLEQVVTDNQGRYGFLVREGTFYIQAAKSGFSFPSKEKSSTFYEKIYTGGDFKIGSKDQTVAFNIPLDPRTKTGLVVSLWIFLIRLNRLLQKLRVPLLLIGLIFSLVMLFLAYHVVYLLSLIFYVLLAVLEYLRTFKARPYGIVTDTFNHPLSMTIVRIYQRENNRLIETDVTDSQGRFRFLVSPGIYYLIAAKPGFVDFKSHLMYLQKEKTQVSTTIKLKKEEK